MRLGRTKALLNRSSACSDYPASISRLTSRRVDFFSSERLWLGAVRPSKQPAAELVRSLRLESCEGKEMSADQTEVQGFGQLHHRERVFVEERVTQGTADEACNAVANEAQPMLMGGFCCGVRRESGQ